MDPARIVVGTIFLVVGGPSVLYAVVSVFRGLSTYAWRRADGVLANSRVEESPAMYGNSYRPRATYSYMVDGKTYLGTRIYFGDDVYWNSPGAAERMLSKISDTPSLTVYYEASNPSESVLLRGVRARAILMMAMALLFAGLGVAVLLGFGRFGRKG